MDSLALIQVLTSFIAGGAFIAGLTLLAEKTTEKVSGIILMFPSTIVLGFFFLGWATSPQEVAEIVPATLVPLGLVVFSSAIYIYCAQTISKIVQKKSLQVLITVLTSTIIWLLLAIPFALFRFSNLMLGIFGYISLTVLTHFLLNKNYNNENTTKPTYTTLQKVYRATFMGGLIALIVILGKTLGAFWGGVFTMFPAATFSALIFFHLHYPVKRLFRFMRKAPIGSVALAIYTIAVMLFFPQYGIIFGSIIAYMLSLLSSLLLIKLSSKS
tara:strand:- start:158 stop:970 length:813 start_codon:yes stop_codon:yes gene_type:complete